MNTPVRQVGVVSSEVEVTGTANSEEETLVSCLHKAHSWWTRSVVPDLYKQSQPPTEQSRSPTEAVTTDRV